MTDVKVSVNDNVVLLIPNHEYCSWTLKGATCETTLRHGIPLARQSCKVFPSKAGTGKGDLVWLYWRHTVAGDHQHPILLHVTRDAKGLVIVAADPTDVRKVIGAQHNYQIYGEVIELRVKGTRYTSDTRATAQAHEKVMVVDPDTILKYIAGHVSLAELKQVAKSILREKSKEQVIKDLERSLAQEQREAKTLRAELARIADEKAALQTSLAELSEVR